MENALSISQIIFYSVFSLAIIVLFILSAIAAWRVIKILKTLQIIASNIHDFSGEAKEKLEGIIENLSLLPILSFFVKKAKKYKNTKTKVEKK